MKRSAGIAVYKMEDNKLKVLLCHFGGPYRENKMGSWSFPKGEADFKESILETAHREFTEETNLKVSTPIAYLGARKTSHNKLTIMFYTEADFDLSNCKSNTFTMEFPKDSGKIQEFPEMDKYAWMDINEAKDKIIGNQLYFLNKWEDKLHNFTF